MNRLYTLLFSLSIILINPIGAMRGEIWTQPKVFAIGLICILNFLMLWEDRESLKLPQSWKISRLLWEIFLGIGLISTLTNPFPWRSLFGQEQMGDGLLYWLLIAIFTLSNNLLLRLHPELLPGGTEYWTSRSGRDFCLFDVEEFVSGVRKFWGITLAVSKG